MKKSIGLDVKSPSKSCKDNHCPFHGNISLHGRILQGRVTGINLHKTITVEFPRYYYLKKYERYEKRKSRIKAHRPDCIDVQLGENVEIMESRPISKTKNFVLVKSIK